MPRTPKPAEPEMPEGPHDDYSFPVVFEWGAFRFRSLPIVEAIRTRRYAEAYYGGPLPLPTSPEALLMDAQSSWMIAEMEQACLEKPDGWEWANLRDAEKLGQAWAGYQQAETSFLASVGGF